MSDAPRIAIIGTGFGGIGMAIRLKEAGIDDFVIYGKSADVGGVWWDNTYPGACCDVPSSLYSFSFEPNHDWSRTHGTQPEIAAYLRHCVEKYGLGPYIRFRTEIVSAAYDEAASVWRLATADGRSIEAPVVVAACGLFNQPAVPEIAGVADFAGAVFHSARWDHGVDLRGKRVGVVGTGCSAAQFVPEIVDRLASLAMFVRTPQYVLPKAEKLFTEEERRRYQDEPALRAVERKTVYRSFERLYKVQVDEDARRAAEQVALDFLAQEITDPEKRARLTPTYRFGCKRTIQSNTYLAALARDHVTIVNDTIARFVPEGIETADGTRHPLDAVIYGTGFKPSEYLSTLKVTGAGGEPLAAAWRDGAEAYLGITIAGFPNLFMIYGPNTNTPNSIVVMLEAQIGYIAKCIRRLARAKAKAMTVRAPVQAAFNEELRQILAGTVWGSGCRNYFLNAAGRVVTQWPRQAADYIRATRKVDSEDFTFTA